AAKKAREDEAEERALRLEVLKVAAGLVAPGPMTPGRAMATADLLLAWIRGETDE
ncbi:MAG: hypothetical protein GY701_28260, partial [Sulfitobacter sp.]|nr:hypothetical protein [Sulfitobacter sp.]